MLASRVDQADARLAAADTAARQAAQEVAAATSSLRALRSELSAKARSIYQRVDQTVAFEAVNTDDTSELGRARIYARAPQEVLDAVVADAQSAKRKLDTESRRADDTRADAAKARDDLRSALAQQRDALAAAESADADAAAAVAAALGSGVALLAQIAAPQFGADDITAALATAQAGDADPATLVGAFHVPVTGVPVGSPYGMRVDPITGALGYHPGIDFEAPAGMEVHAAAAGTVVMAGDCGGYGNCVVVDHGRALATVSAHLSRVLVDVGEPVVDQQVLGLVGSTGRSTGPHLHFEVRLHGIPLDPILALGS